MPTRISTVRSKKSNTFRFLRLVAIAGFGIGFGFTVTAFNPHYRVLANPDTQLTQPQQNFERVVLPDLNVELRLSQGDIAALGQKRGFWQITHNDPQLPVTFIYIGTDSDVSDRLQLGSTVDLLARSGGVYTYRIVGMQFVEKTELLSYLGQLQNSTVLVARDGSEWLVFILK